MSTILQPNVQIKFQLVLKL